MWSGRWAKAVPVCHFVSDCVCAVELLNEYGCVCGCGSAVCGRAAEFVCSITTLAGVCGCVAAWLCVTVRLCARVSDDGGW